MYTSLSVKGLGKLVDWRWNLQSLIQDSLLALESDVLWPFHKSAQVSFRLNILSCKLI